MATNAENAPGGQPDAFQRLSTGQDDAQKISPYRIATQARICDFKLFEKNTLRGFFDIELASGLILRGCTLHFKNEKSWIGLPAKPWTKPDGTQSYTAIIDFRDKQTSYRFQNAVTPLAVAAYEQSQARGAA
jgi:hypothetical protein